MTGPRRVVLVLAALALAGMALYPPWVYYDGSSPGYSWILSPPLVPGGPDARPDFARFGLECVALVGVAGAAFFVVSGRRRGDAEK